MATSPRQLRPLLRVALPVALAAVFICLALINIGIVKTWRGDIEDGILWRQEGLNVYAVEVAPDGPGARAGILPRDLLLSIGGQAIERVQDVTRVMHGAHSGQTLAYVIERATADVPVSVTVQPTPLRPAGLYFSLALVGILAIVVGASVRLRRPNDSATLHFYWLTVAFFGGLAFTMSGRGTTLDYFFYWADAVAWLALPPLFLHFAFVFPDRPNPWVRTDAGRAIVPIFYLPALLLGGARVALMAGGLRDAQSASLLERLESLDLVYLVACLLGGLLIMMRALTRLRSMTARRQLRWIVWGSSTGALPFILLYAVPYLIGHVPPYAEYTAVLLGGIPLAFASAIVRYRLMDIEVILKKGLWVAAVGLVLAGIYGGTLRLVSLVLGTDQDRSSFWALFATLIVALIAPWLGRAIQAGLDRLYYRDRYDYRRALVGFARELNSDLDLDRLSTKLVERVRETLGVDRIALFLPDRATDSGRMLARASGGFEGLVVPPIEAASSLGARLRDGQNVSIDEGVPMRRLAGDEVATWKDAGLESFVACVAKDRTVGVLAVGRPTHGQTLSTEDLTLLGAVAGQAATALENARLYGEVQGKAAENTRLHEFSESVVESLTDGVVVVDLEDRVMLWNQRMEQLVGVRRGRAMGRRLGALLPRSFVETLEAAWGESPGGASLYRVPLEVGDPKRALMVNIAIAPFQAVEKAQARWIVVLEDVTERANLEEQLRLSEKMAAIGLLAAGVAHEVNTPLTGISSFTQMLLERSEPDDPRTQLLEKIERQTFRAAKIVSSLLNLARPQGGDSAPVDLHAVIGDVLSLLEHQFKLSKIQVRRELAPGGLIVRGVEYKLQQVFLNLFLNARDAMPKGGWLTVATGAEEGSAVVEVADTGVGIPSEHLARIYDPFFTTKPEGGGTGLGLSVTYGIVQEHGGSLSCESAAGQGTRFRLALPLIERPAGVAVP